MRKKYAVLQASRGVRATFLQQVQDHVKGKIARDPRVLRTGSAFMASKRAL